MRVLESGIEGKACREVWKKLGVYGLKLHVVGQRGYPDRVFLIPGGRPLLIEFKRPGEVPRDLQAHIHKRLRKLGYQVEVHDDWRDAFEAVKQAVEAAQVPKEGG